MKIFVTRGPIVHEYQRYDDDTAYDVKPALAQYFIGNGWAEPAAKDTEVAEPFNIKNMTDEEAEAWRAGKEERIQRAQAKLAAASAPVELDVHDVESSQEAEF
jgi:hypothetical protein